MNSAIVTIDGCDTLPKLFLKKAAERGDRIAMREKDFGIWQSYSWNDYRAYALDIAYGLLSLGLERGDVVSIQSEDCREWLWTDVGAMLAGGVVNGIYPTYQSRQVEHALTDSKCRFLFAEDEEQLDKFLEIEDAVTQIEKVYVFDWRGLRGFDHPKVAPLDKLIEIGREFGAKNQGLIEKIAEQGSGDDLAALVYTSGTTGMPKGAMLSQRYIIFQMKLAPDYVRMTQADEILTYLPLCHVAERIFSAWLQIPTGTTLNLAESPETVAQNLQELSPTYILAVPRVWEKFYSRVTTAISEATWIGQKAYKVALAIGMRRADKLIAGQPLTIADKILFELADRLVFRNIKKLLGLNRVRAAITGAAPISPSLLKWYLAIGLAIDELWGQTEIGIITTTRKGIFRQGKVGKAISGTNVKISDNGEIIARSIGQFDGYLNLPERTAETIVDGWVHTGDVGELDDEGYLSITDSQGHHHHGRRQKHYAVRHGERAEIFPFYIGCRRHRRRAKISDLPDHDRPGKRRALCANAFGAVYRLSIPVLETGDRGTDRRRSRTRQQGILVGRAGQEVSSDRCAVDGRGRRTDTDHEVKELCEQQIR
jgi:long-chain acyl-CoA synthetase